MPTLETHYSAAQRSAFDPDAESFAAWANVLLRARRPIVLCGMLGAVIALTVAFFLPRTYTSHAVITPQGRQPSSGLAGIASQLNLSIPSTDLSQTPAFYADLLASRELLGQAVETRYTYTDARGGRHTETLIDVYHPRGATVPLRREAAIDKLASNLGIEVVAKTGVLRISAKSRSADLSQQITARLIALLDQFNRQRRRSLAAEERRFTEQRLADATADLRQAENRMQEFLQSNRTWSNSPELTFEHDRLNTDLGLRRDLYSSFAKAFEDARLQEVRDTPVITTIEDPSFPLRPDTRGAAKKLVYGFVLGAMLAALVALRRGAMNNVESIDADPVAEMKRLRRAALQDVLTPWRMFEFRRNGRSD